MGKDQEFLEAARSGNITLVEKILNQKAKRSGPLASLRRGPGSNVQDNSGFSALHHATLNGHIDVVKILLAHDASPNLPDARGASPLHLAAWAGHQDIVKLLLTHPHRPANPNLQTADNETPLHFAAQHGHTGALTTLLAHGADPNVTNIRSETPLDLAAQYGRLQAVQMLIRAHPELLEPFKLNSISTDGSRGCPHRAMINHSPLHLASRNGHKNVVEVLLVAGVNVNLLTPSGTALHEAALCGKDSVVRTLLDFGADMDATDSENRTALDILEEFPPHVTKGIVSVINSHKNSNLYDSESDDVVRDCSNNQHYNTQQQQQQSHYRNRHNQQHQKQNRTKNNLGSSYENSCSSPVHNYYSSSHHEMTSPSSSMGSLGPQSPRQRASSGDLSEFYVPMELKNKNIKSTAPKKPPRRNLSVSPTHLNGGGSGGSRSGRDGFMSMSVDGYTPMGNRSGGSGSDSSSKLPVQAGPVNYEYIFLAHTGNKKTASESRSRPSDDDYVQMMPKPEPRTTLSHSYENTTLKSYNPNRKLRRNRDSYELFSADFNKTKGKKTTNLHCSPDDATAAQQTANSTSPTATINSSSSATTPQSPTNYQQPPTPQHPPPSAIQAEILIHERIRPLNQEYKRRSGILQQTLMMTESSTSPPELPCQSLCASSGSLSSSISISDRSVSTDCVEEFIGDVPFAGLFKGSTMTLSNASISFPPTHSHYQQNYNYSDISMGYEDSSERSRRYHSGQYNDYRMEYHQNRSMSFGGAINPVVTSDREDETISSIYDPNSRSERHRAQSFDQQDNQIVDEKSPREIQTGGSGSSSQPALEPKKMQFNGINNDIFSPFDEEEAWAKISEIMESFGSEILTDKQKLHEGLDDTTNTSDKNYDIMGTNSNILRTKQSHPNIKYSSIRQFLQEINLEHLENILSDSGYDHIDHLNGILDENDLKTLNIPQTDGKVLLEAIEQLPFTKSLSSMQEDREEQQRNNNNSILNVDQWLQDIHLPEYVHIFKRHFCKGFEGGHGCRVWEVELQTVLEINKIGHRKRILNSISNSRKPEKSQSSSLKFHKSSDDLLDCSDGNSIIKVENDHKNHLTATTSASNVTVIKHNNKKNRPAPKPPIRANSLEIRAPSELLLGLPSNLRTQWRHPANVLITGAVTYDVYYLGSTVVKELRGTESTRKSIQKLKRDNRACSESSSGNSLPIPGDFQLSTNCLNQQQRRKQLVRLSISHRGVEFINIESNNTICEHEIRNIHCACQAADDLSHFAYITKDTDISIHYCHVFNADTMDLATEIILTLGQAFEVAYQLALRDTSSKNLMRASLFEVIK